MPACVSRGGRGCLCVCAAGWSGGCLNVLQGRMEDVNVCCRVGWRMSVCAAGDGGCLCVL